MNQLKSWRETIKVHPASSLFPLMRSDELRTLAADIDENGLKHGVVFYCNEPTEKMNRKERRAMESLDAARDGWLELLDGRNRLEAVERFSKKYKVFEDSDEQKAILFMGDFPKLGRPVVLNRFTCPDPYTFVISANAHRRHLTPRQKRELIARLLKIRPERSNRAIAGIIGTSDKTAGAVRSRLERCSEIPHVEWRTDTRGRAQPVVVKRTEASQPVPIAHSDINLTLHEGSAAELNLMQDTRSASSMCFLDSSMRRLLADHADKMKHYPAYQRAVLGLHVIGALGFSVEQLLAILERKGVPPPCRG